LVLRKGSGTGALRKPGNGSGIRVVPADSVPPGTGRTPGAEIPLVSFSPTRLGEEPIFFLPVISRVEGKLTTKISRLRRLIRRAGENFRGR
jgi:hypothetical protein